MIIRDATKEDAAQICELLRRSITELCVDDHKNDPAVLERWANTKTPALIMSWLATEKSSMLVAQSGQADGILLAVGAVTDAGEIASVLYKDSQKGKKVILKCVIPERFSF